MKFMVDHNVGKLAKWLRMMGFDTRIFDGPDDSRMIAAAMVEDRVVLTRDTQIMKRRLVTSGRLKAIFIESDKPELQIRQVVDALDLYGQLNPFTICLECNQPLIKRDRQDVKDLVPSYVFETQRQYMECPVCHRIYWKGTHWQAMTKKLERFIKV